MSITPNLHNSTVFIACCGDGDDSNRWLNAITEKGIVELTYRLPSINVNMSGVLWNATYDQGSDSYTFKTLGSINNPDYLYLDGSPNGVVSLDSDESANSSKWKLISGSIDNYYPISPGGAKQVKITLLKSRIARHPVFWMASHVMVA